jgi:anti-sigma factor RsiW
MTKSKLKHDSLPQHLEQKADSVQAKETVSFDQSMGRIVDGEPLPGDEQIVIQHLRSHPQCVQQVECHLAIDAMLFGEARCDSLAFV